MYRCIDKLEFINIFFLINVECSRQYRRNYRFVSSYVRQTYDVGDADDCERRCVQERSFDCRAFAFSYNNRGNSFRNNRNCELTDRRINDGGYGGGGLYGSNTGYADNQLQSDRVSRMSINDSKFIYNLLCESISIV